MNIRPKDSLSHEPTLLCAAFFLFYSRAILKSSRFLLASHSEKLAMSIRAPFLCAQRFSIREPFWKARDFYSRAFLCAQCYPINKPFWKARYLFAIREPFWKACDLYSRAFPWAHRLLFARLSLCRAAFPICKPFWKARNLYSRAILKSAASCVFLWVCPMEHINCSSLHLPAIVHVGERCFVQEDLLSHEYSPPRLSVSRTNSLV